MTTKVDYEDLLPHEFAERLAHRPVGYLPLGTLEWHGPHGALGADSIQSREIFRRAARRFGGIVFPPLFLGPDRSALQPDGSTLVGMDYDETTTPPHQLAGSCYWAPKGLFLQIVENVLAQAKRAGFRCVAADGHGPSRLAFGEMVSAWESQFDLKLISVQRDFSGRWRALGDHAARNETSALLAIDPAYVDLSRLPADRSEWPQGVGGEDPRESTAAFGEELIEGAVELLGERLNQLEI